jgi:RND family efflux transporter MFP subunit
LSLERLNEPPDAASLNSAQNNLVRAQEAKTQAEKDLDDAYDSGYTSVSNAYLSLPSVMSSLDDVLYGTTLNGSQANIDAYSDIAYRYDKSIEQIKADVVSLYNRAKSSYGTAFSDYSISSRFSDHATVESLVQDSLAAAKDIAEAIKKTKNLVDFTENTLAQRNLAVPKTTSGHQSTLNSLTGTVNSQISSLSNAYDSFENGRNKIIDAERTIVERQDSLAKLQEGPDSFDLRSQNLSIKQKEEAVRDAQAKYADYVVTAPFDGVIAELTAKYGDTVSSGTVLATVITPQKIAQVTLNEVDVAKVKIGQKATMTFDALEDFSVTGEVINIDTFGTSSQGVVTYGVDISLDSKDERILTNMTVSATIITGVESDVLLVPNSAVKTQNGRLYVETLADDAVPGTAPQQVNVTIGAANDESTVVTGGLKEGDTVVTRTIAPMTGGTTVGSPAPTAAVGGARGAGGNVFFMGSGPGR